MKYETIKPCVLALATSLLFTCLCGAAAGANIGAGIRDAGSAAVEECGKRVFRPMAIFGHLIKTIGGSGPTPADARKENMERAERELAKLPEMAPGKDGLPGEVTGLFKCGREELGRRFGARGRWVRSNFYDCFLTRDPALAVYFDCQGETADWIKVGGLEIAGLKPGADFAEIEKALGPSEAFETPFYRGFEKIYGAGEFFVRFSSFEKDGRDSVITVYPRGGALDHLAFRRSAREKRQVPRFEKIKVLPQKDEAGREPSLEKAVNEIKRAVDEKNYEVLVSYLDGDLKWSFGGNDGSANFVRYWRLDSDPKNSGVWNELKEVFRLGGGKYQAGESDGEEASYTLPYTFNAESPLDCFEFEYVTGENVNVRERPGTYSKVVARISYEGVFTSFDFNDYNLENMSYGEIAGDAAPWRKAALSNGKTGFIRGDFIRSGIDYRLSMSKVKGVWKIKYFIAGD